MTQTAAGIRCPECGAETEVHRTRQQAGYVTRRRICTVCGVRITTAERLVGSLQPCVTGDAFAGLSNPQIVESFAKWLEGASPMAARSADSPRHEQEPA